MWTPRPHARRGSHGGNVAPLQLDTIAPTLRHARWPRPECAYSFGQDTPFPLRESLTHHEVWIACKRGWSKFKNGELLDAAEREGFGVLVTTDSGLRYQQNLSGRRSADEAAEAYRRAIGLESDPAVRRFLQSQLAEITS